LKQYVDFNDIANWPTAVGQLSKNYVILFDNMVMTKILRILQQPVGEFVKNKRIFDTAKIAQFIVLKRIANWATAVAQFAKTTGKS
jgi:hypothetical protein